MRGAEPPTPMAPISRSSTMIGKPPELENRSSSISRHSTSWLRVAWFISDLLGARSRKAVRAFISAVATLVQTCPSMRCT